MSILVGPISGALAAGGVYYGFSSLIRSRTERHLKDLHALSARLTESPALVQAPAPAATRITHHHFTALLQAKWNQEVESLFVGLQGWDRRVQDWGRKLLGGAETGSTPPQPPPVPVDTNQT